MNNTKPLNKPAFHTMDNRSVKAMNLRDHFAAKAMQGIMSRDELFEAVNVAEDAYAIADAMLKEREYDNG